MYALVVYESMFGNTRQIAEAVAEGLGSAMEVRVVEVGTAPPVVGEDVALLVVGGPTLVIAGVDLFNTLTAAPGTTQWAPRQQVQSAN